MKLNIKEYFKLSVIYTLIAALPSLLQTLMQPFIVGKGKLNAVDFSQLAITEIITSLVFVLSTYAMANAISRYYYDYIDDKKGYNKLVSTIINSILLRGILILGVSFILSNFIGSLFTQPELRDFSSYGYGSIILGINRSICMTAFALYRNEKKVGRFIVFNLSLGILRTVFQLLALFYFKMSFVGYVYGSCIGSGITTIAILIYTYRYSGFQFDMKILKELNNYARPLFLYGLIAWGIMYAGRFFLENSPKELGIYYMAINFALGIQLVLQGLLGVSQPEVFRFMKEGVEEHLNEISKVCNILIAQTQIIVGLMIIPSMLYLTLFYKSDVSQASSIIGIVFIDFIIKSQSIVFSLPLYYLKKTKFLFIINSSVLVINLLLNYLLVPYFKAYGLIMATLFCDLVLAIGIYIYQNKVILLKWNIKKTIIYPIGIASITCIIEIIKNMFHLNQYLASVTVVLVIFVSLLILYKNELIGFSQKYLGNRQ